MLNQQTELEDLSVQSENFAIYLIVRQQIANGARSQKAGISWSKNIVKGPGSYAW